MASSQHLLLSPAELAYLHSSLSHTPPIRPDGRSATQFRPLTAETAILPGTNGSARVCFADGTEAIVGVKAEVERTPRRHVYTNEQDDGADGNGATRQEAKGQNDWVEVTVEIPGHRDDDSSTIFLSTMLSEALLADGELTKKLWINRRFHWKLYLDIILISPPLSYPLPLLSLTTHLALLSTRLPRLKSEADEDPMFDDDWAASVYLYSSSTSSSTGSPPPSTLQKPPITLLVMAVGDNIIFDPSKEELAVADAALAVSVVEAPSSGSTTITTTAAAAGGESMDVDDDNGKKSAAAAASTGVPAARQRNLSLLAVRTIDPPSRLTGPGVPNAVNAAAWGHTEGKAAADATSASAKSAAGGGGGATAKGNYEGEDVEGVWKAPRGGARVGVLAAMVAKVLERGGMADEVLDGLEGVELG
ncbi:ribosomal protein S5 domain 2-type protein [Microdochium trichocladiopsis]|uniref:Ribosomal RNA-processing protein 42 n=1 Tax=Microdochium trichocladiopsis TaxID=1682393 RepID=A0A9P8YKL6_9PEZI|nr:ribosomal protein S5 domain 2-type protein [Microdochium trichocladiopsis]KAH7040735.1 ribosomal protein S5 domain 2-type protein [Microdochium trichocladiopsis]